MSADDSDHAPLIESIEVDDLFGQFRYRLRSDASSDGKNHLLLLYGDNGAGKSTILNIVFHLLHPEPYEGHRTAVGQIPFRVLKIHLTSGHTILVEKDEPFDDTKYALTLTLPHSSRPVKYTWEHERRARTDARHDAQYRKYCRILSEIGIAFHFLSDTRRVVGRAGRSLVRRHRGVIYRTIDDRIWREPTSEEDTEVLVDRAIDEAIEYLRRLALTGSSEGYTSVNAIYDELIGRITSKRSDDSERYSALDELRSELSRLHDRNSSYAKYGLTPELDTDRLLKRLGRVRKADSEMLNIVLRPYLDGHHARLDALRSVQEVIDEFVTILSDFLAHKTVSLDIRSGLQIMDSNEKRIPPGFLSSGERQLLVLLCNAIAARRDGTILIIDEPEISLNVKWQRRLISALLTCLRGVQTQLIMATHSIEILSQYLPFVASLSDQPDVTADD